MWRFTPDRLTLGLSHQRAVLGIPSRTVRRTLQLEELAPLAASSLDEWIKQQPVARKRVNITLSNACAHHLLVPNSRAVAHYRERDGYARAMTEEAFGIDGADWQIAADDDPFAAQFLTAAVPRKLLGGAQAALSGARAQPGSAQTFFTREWNAHRKSITSTSCWFAVIEADCAVLARVHGGCLASLRTLRAPIETVAALSQAVDREALSTLQDDAPRSVFVTGAALFAQTAAAYGERTFHRLDVLAPGPYAAAERARSRLLWNA